MNKSRIEAFSDGVIAIIITIMVLELKVPAGNDWFSLSSMWHVFLGYVLSFWMLGIYWNNHHHLFQAVKHVNGRILWANLHLLFWLSLVPFVTGWMGESNFSTVPVALYVIVLLLAGMAYFILVRTLVSRHGESSVLAITLGRDVKGIAALTLYSAAVPLAFLNVWRAFSLYVAVAVLYLIPHRQIEKSLHN